MRPASILLSVLVLSACATPREQCINQVTRDLRIINSLIAETQANLSRGYALEESTDVRTVRRFCRGENSDGSSFRYPCNETQTFTTTRPVAIDLNAEQAKLDSLLQRQQQAKAASDQAVLQCIRSNPE